MSKQTEREELARVIVEAYGEDAEVECPCEQDLEVAEAILAAGYTKANPMMARLRSWWRRNVIDTDPNPQYSRLDRMDGLR